MRTEKFFINANRKVIIGLSVRQDMQGRALLLAFMVVSLSLSGCFGESETVSVPEEIEMESPRIFVTDKTGESIGESPMNISFQFSDVGETGKEPSIGITSSGCIFFIAMEKVMRSCDYGASWVESQDPVMCSPTTSDPYGWVDPITDRVFGVQMIGLETSWICWSDDDGETWLGNPHDSGTTPINDHIKLASGPWTTAGYGALGSNYRKHDLRNGSVLLLQQTCRNLLLYQF